MPKFSGLRLGANKEAKRLDLNKNGSISKDELYKFIEKNSRLWAMLSVNLNLSEEHCREVATNVAYQLAKTIMSKSKSDSSHSTEREREPSLSQVQSFLNLVKDPKGEQEFFHRTVFQVFDSDGNGYLDSKELDSFLDIFYKAGSIFAGDVRLPPKETLKKRVYDECDKNGDGKLEFDEIRFIISGGAQCLTTTS